MFLPLDVVLVAPFVASDFHLSLILKKDENSKLLLLSHYYHFKEPMKNTLELGPEILGLLFDKNVNLPSSVWQADIESKN